MSLPADSAAIERSLAEAVARRTGLGAEDIECGRNFHDMGVDSADALAIAAELGRTLGVTVPPAMLWECPNIRALAQRFANPAPATTTSRSHVEPGPSEPVAVIGMACRFPGAPSVDAFAALLDAGTDAITRVPKDRWDAAALFDANRDAPGRMTTRWGGFLDRIDCFDADYFGIAPVEALQMDPQQRLALELAVEACEAAGLAVDRLRGTTTGVFVGAMWGSDYARIATPDLDAVRQHSATGLDHGVLAGRVSYTMGLQGPSLAVNTACSSSLTAIHLACQSLRDGDSDMALAGGVNLICGPGDTVAMSKFGGLSPDGRCKPFAAGANGYVRGEGGGIVVLKRLTDAMADGDTVLAVVRGSAINNDGASNGLTAPNPLAQRALLQQACTRAGLDPSEIDYIEAHGTGTALGDPIEASALGAVFGQGRPADRPLVIGSVKSNIGHLEAAAGIAGFIKTVIAMRAGRIPATLHCNEPNPAIPFADLGLRLPDRASAWPLNGRKRRAGVSAFGFGGSNAHVVLEAATDTAPVSLDLPRADRAPVRLTFVFSGSGGVWPGMARDLLAAEPVFRRTVEACDGFISPRLGWPVLRAMVDTPPALAEPIFAQPLQFALQAGLWRLFQHWNIVPERVIGHSTGEVAAAFAAGLLDLDEACRLTCERAEAEQRLCGKGGMLQLALAPDQAAAWLGGLGLELDIAAHNAPSLTVVAGSDAAIAAAEQAAVQHGVPATRIAVPVPHHSRWVDPELAGFAASLGPVRLGMSRIAFQSTIRPDAVPDAAYWCQALRAPVRFAETIREQADDGIAAFVEIGPHPLLRGAIGKSAGAASVLGTLKRGTRSADSLAATLRDLAALGHGAEPRQRPTLVSVSAHTPAALRARVAALTSFAGDVTALGWSRAVRATHRDHRTALVAQCADSLRQTAQDWLDRNGSAHAAQPRRVVMVFPGQGGQWPGMGTGLLREPAFRSALDLCNATIQRHGGRDVFATLRATAGDPCHDDVSAVQPALFALQVALARQLAAWGIVPDAVAGHSMGEVAAAHIAGILSLDDAARIICVRSRLLAGRHAGGAMAVAGLSAIAAEAALCRLHRDLGLPADTVVAAAWNGPEETVVSGAANAVARLAEMLEREGTFVRLVRVGVASHSPQVEPLLGPLMTALSGIAPNKVALPMLSTVTGQILSGPDLDETYWCDNLRRPVRFHAAVTALSDRHSVFVEVAPHPVLSAAMRQTLTCAGQTGGVVTATLRRDEPELSCLLKAAGQLYAAGVSLNWDGIYPDGGRFVPAEPYPWQRVRYWPDHPTRQTPEIALGRYDVDWQPAPVATRHTLVGSHFWLIGNGAGLAAALGETILARGGSAGTLTAPAEPQAVRDRQNIIYLRALDLQPDDPAAAAAVVGDAVAWVCHIAEGGRGPLTIVTAGARPIGHDQAGLSALQAPLWGLGGAIASEHSVIWRGLIDLDPDLPLQTQAGALLDAILAGDKETRVAVRSGQRLVSRLKHRPPPRPAGPLVLASDARYLVTGGLGGLGLRIAGWLADHGARHIDLIGRRGLDPSDPGTEAVSALRARGIMVTTAAVDVADRAALAAWLESADGPPLRGIVHAAGVLHEAPLGAQHDAAIDAQLRPKLHGAWWLHELTRRRALDFLVLFSSFSSLIDSPNLGGYAAANAALDGIAALRRRDRQPVTLLNWGFWDEAGMAARAGWTSAGTRPIPISEGLQVLAREIAASATSSDADPAVGVMAVDWPRWAAAHPDAASAPLLSALLPTQIATAPLSASPAISETGFDSTAPDWRDQLDVLVFRQTVEVAGLPATVLEPDKPFRALGIDSLMLMDLRRRIEHALGLTIRPSDFFNHPTPGHLAAFLAERLTPRTEPEQEDLEDVVELLERELQAQPSGGERVA
jgi:acyl transferase domain-containing protein/acyl carrier protein